MNGLAEHAIHLGAGDSQGPVEAFLIASQRLVQFAREPFRLGRRRHRMPHHGIVPSQPAIARNLRSWVRTGGGVQFLIDVRHPLRAKLISMFRVLNPARISCSNCTINPAAIGLPAGLLVPWGDFVVWEALYLAGSAAERGHTAETAKQKTTDKNVHPIPVEPGESAEPGPPQNGIQRMMFQLLSSDLLPSRDGFPSSRIARLLAYRGICQVENKSPDCTGGDSTSSTGRRKRIAGLS